MSAESNEQELFDQKRRAYAATLIAACGPSVARNKDPAAIIGALCLAAGVLADRHGLTDVMGHILDDVMRDSELLAHGEWSPEDYEHDDG